MCILVMCSKDVLDSTTCTLSKCMFVMAVLGRRHKYKIILLVVCTTKTRKLLPDIPIREVSWFLEHSVFPFCAFLFYCFRHWMRSSWKLMLNLVVLTSARSSPMLKNICHSLATRREYTWWTPWVSECFTFCRPLALASSVGIIALFFDWIPLYVTVGRKILLKSKSLSFWFSVVNLLVRKLLAAQWPFTFVKLHRHSSVMLTICSLVIHPFGLCALWFFIPATSIVMNAT